MSYYMHGKVFINSTCLMHWNLCHANYHVLSRSSGILISTFYVHILFSFDNISIFENIKREGIHLISCFWINWSRKKKKWKNLNFHNNLISFFSTFSWKVCLKFWVLWHQAFCKIRIIHLINLNINLTISIFA